MADSEKNPEKLPFHPIGQVDEGTTQTPYAGNKVPDNTPKETSQALKKHRLDQFYENSAIAQFTYKEKAVLFGIIFLMLGAVGAIGFYIFKGTFDFPNLVYKLKHIVN